MAGRRDTSKRYVQVAFRLPPDLVQRLDAYAERMGSAFPGLAFNRADAVRTLLTRALDEEDARSVPAKRKGP
jgi:predicted DNA-binding protein